MATLVINGNETFQLEHEADATVLDLLLAAQEDHWGEERFIQKLVVNGEEIEPLAEDSLKGIPAKGVRLEVTLSEVRSLETTLDEAVAYLTKLSAGFEALAENIRIDATQETFKSLSDGIHGLLTILDLFNAFTGHEDIPQSLQDEFKEFLKEFNEKSQELAEAQESRDPTLIADIMEYEFVEGIQDLQGFLTRFREHLV